MQYDIYGKFKIEVVRKNDVWLVFRIGQGVKLPEYNVHIPDNASEKQVLMALDDAFHEFARPGAVIQTIESIE